MSETSKLPTGLLLQYAGLISFEHLQKALEFQAQDKQKKLGEILVSQQGIKSETIDFFVNQWQTMCDGDKIFPIGYYLQRAYLLSEKQIEKILQEQKNNRQKFGIIAVEKGWVKQHTIDFFLHNLSCSPPELMSLSLLEEYNQEYLHLEKKYLDYSLIMTRILAWTGGIPVLTKVIAQVFAKSDLNIPGGKEANAVDQFVEKMLIKKWQTTKSAESIREIKQNLLSNVRCDSYSLLQEYRKILFSDNKKYQGSREQKELLLLGLVIRQHDLLKISNVIYQQVFNQDFVINELEKITPKSPASIDNGNPQLVSTGNSLVEYTPQIEAIIPLEPQDNTEVQVSHVSQQIQTKPKLLTKIGYILSGTVIASLFSVLLAINNNYSASSKPGQINTNSPQTSEELQQFCSTINFSDANSALSLIFNLETTQKQLLNKFPANCNQALNQLRIAVATELGKEDRTIEAIQHLCKVPPSSEMYVAASAWLKHWHDSKHWGKETKFYLEELEKHHDERCSAGNFRDKKSS